MKLPRSIGVPSCGVFVVIAGVVATACSGTTTAVPDGSVLPPPSDASGALDDGQAVLDDAAAGNFTNFDAAADEDADGVPTRNAACTEVKELGTALTSLHGRLDGTLVAIVPLNGSGRCNADSTHVHLQVLVNGSVYDVAVNADANLYETDMALPDGPWAEGWQTAEDALTYPSIGIHSTDFVTSPSLDAMAAHIEAEMATVNHISIFCTGYGDNGCHDVHREGLEIDGAIFIEPLSSPAHMLAFDFSDGGVF